MVAAAEAAGPALGGRETVVVVGGHSEADGDADGDVVSDVEDDVRGDKDGENGALGHLDVEGKCNVDGDVGGVADADSERHEDCDADAEVKRESAALATAASNPAADATPTAASTPTAVAIAAAAAAAQAGLVELGRPGTKKKQCVRTAYDRNEIYPKRYFLKRYWFSLGI